jgi:hypothetical protein
MVAGFVPFYNIREKGHAMQEDGKNKGAANAQADTRSCMEAKQINTYVIVYKQNINKK